MVDKQQVMHRISSRNGRTGVGIGGGVGGLPGSGAGESSLYTGRGTSTSSTHSAFLQLRLEPSLSTSLLDVVDIFFCPVSMSSSVPNTPPPLYEPPPPSYKSDAVSIYTLSTIDLDVQMHPASTRPVHELSMRESDAISASLMLDPSEGILDLDFGEDRRVDLQSELLLNLFVYEILAHQSTAMSRSPLS